LNLPLPLTQIIAQTHLFTDAVDYIMVRIPAESAAQVLAAWGTEAGMAALVRDKDETSLLVAQSVWEHSPLARKAWPVSPIYRLITLDTPLDFSVVGYLAAWTAVLAEAGISILALSTFSRDHLFVPAGDFDRAWALLTDLIQSYA